MPFEKGKSGNPGGRPKEKPFRNALMMELKEAGEHMPALREIARNMIERAKLEDAPAKEIADRLDGKPAQAIVGDDDHDPISLAITRLELVAPDLDDSKD